MSAGLKSLAVAAGLAGLAFAGQAAANTPPEANPTTSVIQIQSATMNTAWTANVGTNANNRVDAYSNGVTFSYVNLDPGTLAPVDGKVYTLFGFCVDITHDMYINTTLNYNYTDTFSASGPSGNPLPTDFHGGNIGSGQLNQLTALIDTGWLLHETQLGLDPNSNDYLNINLQLAAIQAAIWHVEGGDVTLNNGGGTAGTNAGGAISGSGVLTYQQYYDAYTSVGGFTDLGDHNDTFYTIVEAKPNYDNHQAFAVGWPIAGTPEPATWAMMLLGFGGLGAMLRARRQRAALA